MREHKTRQMSSRLDERAGNFRLSNHGSTSSRDYLETTPTLTPTQTPTPTLPPLSPPLLKARKLTVISKRNVYNRKDQGRVISKRNVYKQARGCLGMSVFSPAPAPAPAQRAGAVVGCYFLLFTLYFLPYEGPAGRVLATMSLCKIRQ